LALAVPLSRFTSRVGGGSAFFVRHHGTIASRADFFSGSCAASFWWWDFVGSWCGYKESRIVEDWWLYFIGRSSYFMFAACGRIDLFWMAEGFQII